MSHLDFGKVASAVGVAAGLLAVGAAAGVVAERAVVAKAGRADREGDEPFGHLRGHSGGRHRLQRGGAARGGRAVHPRTTPRSSPSSSATGTP